MLNDLSPRMASRGRLRSLLVVSQVAVSLVLLIGVIGAIVGGMIGGALFDVGLRGFFHLSTWLLAIAGSLIVLFIWGLITKRRTA